MSNKFTGKTSQFQEQNGSVNHNVNQNVNHNVNQNVNYNGNQMGQRGLVDEMMDGVVGTVEGLYQSGKRAIDNSPGAEERRRKKIMAKIKDFGADECGVGAVLGIIAFCLFMAGSPIGFVFALGGGGFLAKGLGRKKQGQRMMSYWKLIQSSSQFSLSKLSNLTNIETNLIYKDIQLMLDKSLLPDGFLDRSNGVIVLKNVNSYIEAYQETESLPELSKEDADILHEIRQINQSIKNPKVSEQIVHVANITGKILAYEKENSCKNRDLQRFLDYYLPTTLKLLRSYSQMEAQNIQGENISNSMAQIEAMMDKVVEGFEKQLDQLFQSETMDIATDVAVLEQMFEKDGLAGNVLKMDTTPKAKNSDEIQLKL